MARKKRVLSRHKTNSHRTPLSAVLVIIPLLTGFIGITHFWGKIQLANTGNRQQIVLPSIPQKKEEIVQRTEVLGSPDGRKAATFFYKGQRSGKGDPYWTHVTIIDHDKKEEKTYPLEGNIRYGNDLFWSPIDNRIYFTLTSAGTGIYALWSSGIEGKNEKLMSGREEGGKYESTLANSAVFGANDIDYSPDGRMIVAAKTDYDPQLWVMEHTGDNSHPIPDLDRYEAVNAVKWLSDGIHIEFVVQNGSEEITYITDIYGTSPTRISSERQ